MKVIMRVDAIDKILSIASTVKEGLAYSWIDDLPGVLVPYGNRKFRIRLNYETITDFEAAVENHQGTSYYSYMEKFHLDMNLKNAG